MDEGSPSSQSTGRTPSPLPYSDLLSHGLKNGAPQNSPQRMVAARAVSMMLPAEVGLAPTTPQQPLREQGMTRSISSGLPDFIGKPGSSQEGAEVSQTPRSRYYTRGRAGWEPLHVSGHVCLKLACMRMFLIFCGSVTERATSSLNTVHFQFKLLSHRLILCT